ncbi:uncharacterized protein LOC114120622 isoform X2 [Aphis gossypii]|uniref:uncharacterized protein LOC114120622 isoform X2 n=1 Tax=Aphis gossypii TaxID=80765 RepID=UPI00215927CD|nr:uncharacterized protein LOC114120622 isoform X2 [Aphis gossypii]
MMIIKPILTHLFKSLPSHGRKACNTWKCSVNNSSGGIIQRYKLGKIAFLKAQYKMTMLQREHDPEFNVESFKKGAKQAISVITKSLSENKSTDSYLSWDASKELERISHTWSESVRANIALEPSQINQLIILKVTHIEKTDGIVYQILTFVAGYKQFSDYSLEILIQARFERLYSEFEKPEWIVTNFTLRRMATLTA